MGSQGKGLTIPKINLTIKKINMTICRGAFPMRTPDDQRGGTIRQFILANLDEHPHDITTLTATRFDMTRQAVNLHILRLIKDAQITRKGKTRKTRFYLARKKTWQKHYSRQQSESDVWESDVLPHL